jgi:2-amino-4-hydroxy-6-hydroxymethyldihydropteridine diphosphokinase
MRYEEWEPFYLKIVNEFGYSISEDSRAAAVLSDILSKGQQVGDVASFMGEKVRGRSFVILGPCPLGQEGLSRVGADIRTKGAVLVTVGEGTRNAIDFGLMPEMIFTDLDGFPEMDMKANEKGAVVVVHAHGDNITRLKSWVPRFRGRIIPTCQCAPIQGVHNWGGFTDGDRAFCALKHFGANSIILEGFDFKTPCGSKHVDIETKKHKLEWAERIIGLNMSETV